ncbi:MAG TPA: translocation/assembly module TamB domain-containing protein [Terriglobales bacterium]|nr:translocation/assembly module TamB domain-containing protein [Terriglobales bacterium]
MSEPGAKPRWRRFRNYLLFAGVLCLLLLGSLSWYATTDSFQALVRRRVVAELERTTGGRVDLGGIHTIPFRFQVEIRDLTTHGRESASEVPYAHVDHLVARIKLISTLGAEFGFSSLVLDHPVVHIVFYGDGTTNQPAPRLKSTSTRTSIEQLFSLSISQLEVRRGELLWNDQRTPFEFIANDVSADMSYSLLHRRYDGNLLLGKIDTTFENYRPVAWMTEAHFTLNEDGIQVRSLKATSGRSRLEASGRLVDFRQPSFTGKYDLTLDLGEANAIARHTEIRQGVLKMAGEGSWSSAVFSSTGKLSVTNFDWRDQSVGLRGASLSSDYAVNHQRLAFSQLQARLLGGEIVGDAEVINWLNSAPAKRTAKGNAADEQKGSVRLRLKDVSAAEVAAALSSAARPLYRLKLAGAASGRIEAQWRGSPRNTEADITLDVNAPAQLKPGELPLNAHANAKYRAAPAELEVVEFNASTRATQVRAAGTLSSTAAMSLSLATSDLSEWQPALTAVGYQEQIPVVLQGHATFNGTATGKVSAIDFAGRLQSEDFDLLIPATSRAPKKTVHCDSLIADVHLSPHAFAAHNGRLHHGDTTFSFDFSAGLQERQFTDSSPIAARVDVRNADADEMLALSGYDLPVSGNLNIFVQIEGSKADPRGNGHIDLTDAMISGRPVQHLDSKLVFDRDEISLDDLHLAYYDAHVTGSGTYNLSSRAFRLNLTGDNFDVAGIPPLQASRVRLDGRMDFTAQASGTLEQPVINANIHLRDLAFDHERAGDYTFEAVTRGSELQVTGHSQFKDAELNIEGKVQLRGDWPTTVNLHFNHLDVDSVFRNYLKRRVTGQSAVAGDLQLRGPLRQPRELEVIGNLSDFFADVEHIKVRNNGPISFTISNQFLRIQQFHLIGEGTDLTVGGTVQLNGEYELDLRAQGHANLQLIQSFNSDFTTSGEVAVDLTVGGTISKPTTQGRLQIANGSIAYSDLPSAISTLNGSLVFNQDRLQIETLTARVGGGVVTFGGYATAYNHQLNFNLTLQTQDVRLRYPPGVSSMANADLRWAGTTAASVLSGDITITKLAVTPGFDFGAGLARASQSSALPQTNPLLNRIRMDVHIVTTPELQMQTAVVRLSGDGDLHLRGTAAKPVLLGRADITEGEVFFNGTKYRLERGDITFSNPVTTTPVLDLQASTHVRDYDITVNLNGSLDKLNLTYHSEPPLPVADIISLLALGQTQQQSAQLQQSGQSPFAQQASSAILAEALNSAISNRSRSLFGISHIRVDPQGLNTETSPTTSSPAVTIEQQVKDNLTLTYTTNVSQTSQQIIQAEYNVTRNISILALRDYNGVISFEVRIRQRKK